jgi:hypothetical protein
MTKPLVGESVNAGEDGQSVQQIAVEQSTASPSIERCRREIAEIEAQIRAGNPDLQGLCRALADWSAELRLLQRG